jgi:hypothetical protein
MVLLFAHQIFSGVAKLFIDAAPYVAPKFTVTDVTCAAIADEVSAVPSVPVARNSGIEPDEPVLPDTTTTAALPSVWVLSTAARAVPSAVVIVEPAGTCPRNGSTVALNGLVPTPLVAVADSDVSRVPVGVIVPVLTTAVLSRLPAAITPDSIAVLENVAGYMPAYNVCPTAT